MAIDECRASVDPGGTIAGRAAAAKSKSFSNRTKFLFVKSRYLAIQHFRIWLLFIIVDIFYGE